MKSIDNSKYGRSSSPGTRASNRATANSNYGGPIRPRSPSHAAKNKTPEDRICEFGYMLMEREGRLICRPCNLILDYTRRSTIVEHLRSRKHQRYLGEASLELSLSYSEPAEPPIVLMDVKEEESAGVSTGGSIHSNPSSRQPSPSPQGMTGPYLLKKETHCHNILDELLKDETYADVTLTAEGRTIKAHRIILSLSSKYFRNVLSSEPNAKNVVLFRDMKFQELRDIVNFIYTGEVTVDASDLDVFMKTADVLEVTSLCNSHKNFPKGFNLGGNYSTESEIKQTSSKRSNPISEQSPPSKVRKTFNENTRHSKKSSAVVHQPSAPSPTSPPPPIKIEEEEMCDDPLDLESNIHAECILSDQEEHDPGDDDDSLLTSQQNCLPCSSTFENVDRMNEHLLEDHENVELFPCEVCVQIFGTLKEFNKHKKNCRPRSTTK